MKHFFLLFFTTCIMSFYCFLISKNTVKFHQTAHYRLHKKKNAIAKTRCPRCFDIYGAAMFGHKACLETLLSQGANPNELNNSFGRETVVQTHYTSSLSEYVHNIPTALHIALRYGHDECALLLISYKSCTTKRDEYNQTPLHTALEKSCHKTSTLLITQSADPNEQDYLLRTPLHLAVKTNNTSAVEALLAKETINQNMQDFLGKTPVHSAVIGNAGTCFIECLMLLLAHPKTSVTIRGIDGITALHIASQRGDLACIKLLVEKDCASLFVKTKTNKMPIDYASGQALALLQSYHAQAAIFTRNQQQSFKNQVQAIPDNRLQKAFVHP